MLPQLRPLRIQNLNILRGPKLLPLFAAPTPVVMAIKTTKKIVRLLAGLATKYGAGHSQCCCRASQMLTSTNSSAKTAALICVPHACGNTHNKGSCEGDGAVVDKFINKRQGRELAIFPHLRLPRIPNLYLH